MPLPDKVIEFLETVVFPHYFEICNNEQNKEVIEKTLECFREVAEEFGPGSVHSQMDKIVKVLI